MVKEQEKFIPSNLFEGMTSIRAILKAGELGISDRRITEILYDSDRTNSRAKELLYLERISKERGFVLTCCRSEEIDALTIGNSHGGIVARCTDRSPVYLENLPEGKILPKGFYVMLDGIEDPYNFGYALRSIYAAGADGIILPQRNWMSAAGVVCRASAGASELFPLYTAAPDAAALLFHRRGYRIVCADKKNSVSAWTADLHRPVFLIVGGEKRGIRASVMAQADCVVRIDYGREFPAALSAASAAAILSYEVFRQNQQGSLL